MRRNNIFKGILGGLLIAMLTPLNTLMLTSCSDEPDSEYFYTFTGEMMSDWLKSPDRPEYSEFAEIVERAGLMNLLATYGHYTCFAPSNDAIDKYLQSRGLSSVSQLSDADCDTIARTHLISQMYTTYDMIGHKLSAMNMMNRYLATDPGFDNDSNAVIVLEGVARIEFNLKDDSVENGIMQPVDMVIEKSNSYISDILRDNPKISTFYKALVATGVINDVMLVEDDTYDPNDYEPVYHGSGETNTSKMKFSVPTTKKYGYTFFIEPDSLLEAKYNIKKGDIQALYDLACTIYDEVYPQDKTAPGHSFENLTDSVNPLHRFIQYHILNMIAAGADDLTPMEVTNKAGFIGAIGIDESLINPSDWHYTLLPHTMIKVDKVTVEQYLGESKRGDRYINRRIDAKYPDTRFPGQRIDPIDNDGYKHDGLNGHYFYVDDIVAFTTDVRDLIHNQRIRMDFNTIFPEFITNGLRQMGHPWEPSSLEEKDGLNWFFPEGYLDGVKSTNCEFVWLRPRCYANIYMWDEFNLFGNYDFTFRLPPVPFDGEWQIRLGFTQQNTRGVAQIYIDNIPQGIPLDMTKKLSDEYYIGDSFEDNLNDYDSMSEEDKAEYIKSMKNLGVYTHPRSIYCDNGGRGERGYCIIYDIGIRKIISQSYLDCNQDHYMRIRVASDGVQGNGNEFALDFLELVPKSVFGTDNGEDMEDDL